jgi:hypothetical protein
VNAFSIEDIIRKGFCPFRVESSNHFQAGCVLRMAQAALCYTQDVRPLLCRTTHPEEYYCPLIKFSLERKLYDELESVLAPLLLVQDEQNTAINIWPMIKGWANSKEKARSAEGQRIVRISTHVKETLEELVCDFM